MGPGSCWLAAGHERPLCAAGFSPASRTIGRASAGGYSPVKLEDEYGEDDGESGRCGRGSSWRRALALLAILAILAAALAAFSRFRPLPRSR